MLLNSEHDHGKPLWTVVRRFARWRGTRPFWAGACTLLAGLIVLFPPFAALRFGDVVISLNTLGGVSAMVIGVVLSICGITFWARPQFRMAAGIVTLLLSLVALVTVNLGSFLIGTVLGIIGSALGIAWSPGTQPARNSSAPGENTA